MDVRVGFDDWVVHDLRRTVTTGLAALGIPFEVAGAVLNHSRKAALGVTSVYLKHKFEVEKRAALVRWAEHVARMITGTLADRVVPLRSA